MSKGEVVLLDFWVSPFSQRVKIALEEKGVAYEVREEDLFGGKSELLLKSNPIHQKVPVLLHNEKPMAESAIIVSYIDETWPEPALLPPCAFGRAQARFWADFIDKKVFDGGRDIWLSKGGDEVIALKDAFIETLKTLEGALAENDYFGGDKFGFVDIMLIPLTTWFYAYEKFGGFKVEDECPKISEWIKRCMKKESVAKILSDPEKVYQCVIMLRKMNGIE